MKERKRKKWKGSEKPARTIFSQTQNIKKQKLNAFKIDCKAKQNKKKSKKSRHLAVPDILSFTLFPIFSSLRSPFQKRENGGEEKARGEKTGGREMETVPKSVFYAIAQGDRV